MYMREYGHRLGETAILKGRNGRQWEVGVSKGTWTGFRVGWKTFAAAYNLEVGDKLEFTLIADSTFLVKVFDTKDNEKTGSSAGPLEVSGRFLGKRKLKDAEENGVAQSMFSSNELKTEKENQKDQQVGFRPGSALFCKRARTKRFANNEVESNVENLSQNKRVVPSKREEQAVRSEESRKDVEVHEHLSIRRLRNSRSVEETVEVTRESRHQKQMRPSNSENYSMEVICFDGDVRPVESTKDVQRRAQTDTVTSGKDSGLCDSGEETSETISENVNNRPDQDPQLFNSAYKEQYKISCNVPCLNLQGSEILEVRGTSLPCETEALETKEVSTPRGRDLNAIEMEGQCQDWSTLVLCNEGLVASSEVPGRMVTCNIPCFNAKESEELGHEESDALGPEVSLPSVHYSNRGLCQNSSNDDSMHSSKLTACTSGSEVITNKAQIEAPVDVEIGWKEEREVSPERTMHQELGRGHFSDNTCVQLPSGGRAISLDLRLSTGIQ